MKIIYSLPHPGDRLDSQRAGHSIRASAMLGALEKLGHTVVRVEAASEQKTQAAVNTYRGVVKKMLPAPVAMRMRDAGRVMHGRQYAARLIDTIHQARPDLILETHIAFSQAGKMASEQTGLPLILDDVAPAWEEEQQYGVGLKGLARRIYGQVTGQAKLLIAVNPTIRDYLIKEGLPAHKIVTIENGIDENAFHPQVSGQPHRAKYGLSDDTIVIVFVGSFQPYHRVDLLLQAYARVNTGQPTHLLLVGEGRETPASREIVQRLGLSERVTFAGRIPYEEVAAYTAAGDIAIMPATNEYGNPMKIYEYMALGKAVLAPNQETITQIATHGHDAYLFERENIEAMAAALETVIRDEALRRQLGRQASQSAADHTWTRRAELLQQAIQTAGLWQPGP